MVGERQSSTEEEPVMSKFTSVLTSLALVVTIAALPGSAMARGSGGPAGDHRGCVSNNGIPLDDGQSVLVDGETISCNNGTVCHSKAGQIPYCYVNVQAAAEAVVSGGRTGTPPKKLSLAHAKVLKKAKLAAAH
jgi:hypothetical protein